MKPKIQQRPRTIKHLESTIRQEGDEILLQNLQQLVSSVLGRLQSVVKSRRIIHKLKQDLDTSFWDVWLQSNSKLPYLYPKIVQLPNLNIWYIRSTLNKIWLNERCKSLHFPQNYKVCGHVPLPLQVWQSPPWKSWAVASDSWSSSPAGRKDLLHHIKH